MTRFVAALDQGTTSTRCILFDRWARICGRAEMEHRQFYPQPGWVEHDAAEIWRNAQAVLAGALADAGATVDEVAAFGIANQRETVVLWDRNTGRPIAPAIVWQDTRTDGICRELARDGGIDRFRGRTGLPVAGDLGDQQAALFGHACFEPGEAKNTYGTGASCY
ncbi:MULTISPECIES: FGGY family carbohydrate kinase [Methylococcus]|uniref:FGGY family carbohydrate kinase n=1 Tax=Methylococcus capsulatus TaxID=414 RepID=A0ABZ2F7E6_METCP|nr:MULTISPECIES: FGGY family carbohydrate kinase [Methylococcus]